MDISDIKCGLKLVYVGEDTPHIKRLKEVLVREIQLDIIPADSKVFVDDCLVPVLPADLIKRP